MRTPRIVYFGISVLLLLAAIGAVGMVSLDASGRYRPESDADGDESGGSAVSCVAKFSGLVLLDVSIPAEARECQCFGVFVVREAIVNSDAPSVPATSRRSPPRGRPGEVENVEAEAGDSRRMGKVPVVRLEVLSLSHGRPDIVRVAIVFTLEDGVARMNVWGKMNFVVKGGMGEIDTREPARVRSEEQDEPVESRARSRFPSNDSEWVGDECELGYYLLRTPRGKVKYRFILRQME